MNERERRAVKRIDECLAWSALDRTQWLDQLLDDRLILMENPPEEEAKSHDE